jgi:hypothetical protein
MPTRYCKWATVSGVSGGCSSIRGITSSVCSLWTEMIGFQVYAK